MSNLTSYFESTFVNKELEMEGPPEVYSEQVKATLVWYSLLRGRCRSDPGTYSSIYGYERYHSDELCR